MKKYYFILITTLLLTLSVSGQQRCKVSYDMPNYEVYAFDTLYQMPAFVKYRENFRPAASSSLAVLNQLFKVEAAVSWRVKRTEKDHLGFEHCFYQSYYEGVEVEGSVVAIHSRNGKIESINGVFLPVKNKEEALLTAKEAIHIALSMFEAKAYKWAHQHEEALIKEIKHDESATWYPKPILSYVNPQFDLENQNLKLSYKLDLYADEPLFAYRLYIDATNGQLLAKEDLIHEIDKPGKAVTKYSDTQNIVTDSFAANNYRLRETGRGKGIETYNMKKGTNYGAAVDFTDADNFWDTINNNKDEIATDAHWGAEKTYDFFYNFFGRNSFDGNGAKIRSYVHYGNNYNNAFWNGSVMTYGDGNGTAFTPLTSVDVCGHEVAHAVTTNTAALVYSYESGALNESFSDIFGNSIEYYARPNKFNWRIGEDITPSGQGIRNMANPNQRNHPDTYKGTYWYTGTGDNGGVHYNSGVQNYWYYLLCEGGIGKNDKADSFFVDSIGMIKAQQIAYRNLSVYLTRNSQYADARFYAIQAAVDLFGNCSPEVIATTNAWHAVGVGARYDSGKIEANFLADTFFCRAPATVQFINTSINTNAYDWKFGDGNSSQLVNPQHTYTQYGSYSIELIAKGCFVNQLDTLLRTAYVVIDSTQDICKGTLMPYGTWSTMSVCTGFIYDNGGEGKYKDLIRDTLTIAPLNCDSIVLTFLDFDYENKFDSLFIYDGPTPAFPKIGGYTGSTLPNGGLPLASSGGSITLVHFSDQLVHGRGFKASVKAYRPKLSLTAMPDSIVCFKQAINLVAHPRGGYIDDYIFKWNTVYTQDSILPVVLQQDSIFEIELIDACTDLRDTAQIKIGVRAPLQLTNSKDTTICYGSMATLQAFGSNGLVPAHMLSWNGVHVGNSYQLILTQDSTSMVVLSDGCSGQNDTAFIRVRVLNPLSMQKSKDTLICNGTLANLAVTGQGGNGNYLFSWLEGLGSGTNKAVNPTATTTYVISMQDGCTVPNISDSIRVIVREALKVSLPADTTLCQGQSIWLNPSVSGGDTLNRSTTWNNNISASALQVISTNDTLVYVQADDKCSPVSRDSIFIRLLAPLKISVPMNDTLCVGQSKILMANATGGRPSTYQFAWLGFGLGNTINADPLVTTSYTAVVSDGCTVNSDSSMVKLWVRPALQVATNANATICAGDTVLLTATASGGVPFGYTLDWSNGVGKGNNKLVAPLSTTWYEVVLNDGCSNYHNDSILITVKPTPQVDFFVQSSPVCTNRSVSLINQTNPSTLDTYLWDLGDGTTATTRDVNRVYNQEGFYGIKLRMTNDLGCTKTKFLDSIIEVVAMPNPSFLTNGDIISFDNPILITNNTSSKAISYLWDFGDLNTSTQNNPTHTYSDTGRFNISLTAINRLGCDSTFSKRVWIKPEFRAHIPNAFTPHDQNGNNDAFRPVITGAVEMKMMIFNRWGGIMYESEKVDALWDGKDRAGNFFPNGNYLYYINIIDVDGIRHEFNGNVLLIR